MTRDKLVEILDDAANFIGGKQYTIGELADRILAAIEKERGGEVVLGVGVLETIEPTPWTVAYKCNGHEKANGVKGQLIFRPAKGKGE